MVQDLGGSAQSVANELLGSPIAVQRQIAYALASGLSIACLFPPSETFLEWFELWLGLSAMLLAPVSYWTTGVFPFSGQLNRILGPEISFRRRIIFSLILTAPMSSISSFLVAPPSAAANGQIPQDAISADFVLLGNLFLNPLALLGNFLLIYYLMGFVASWRAVNGCEFSFTSDGLGDRAAELPEQIRRAMDEREIPSFEFTRVPMAKLRHYTAGASSATSGEQLSFISGKARMVVFVQNFGTSLFVRATGFYDASGRRLWLYFGFLVSSFDRLVLRWFGTSPIEQMRLGLETLSPATRNQILLRPDQGGVISRALRLTEGVSEYSWNELFALAGTVRETITEVLAGSMDDRKGSKRMRAQLERQARFEKMSSGSSRGPGR
ncbi:MAG: hypothetical protein KDD47_00095 [Acidobacteria bacterium]|nr:hypothetical protein [Acidobacteriota bacterium]